MTRSLPAQMVTDLAADEVTLFYAVELQFAYGLATVISRLADIGSMTTPGTTPRRGVKAKHSPAAAPFCQSAG